MLDIYTDYLIRSFGQTTSFISIGLAKRLSRTCSDLTIAAAILMAAVPCTAQQSKPGASSKPSVQSSAPSGEAQEAVKVLTEEVRLPVVAYDDDGRFDPALEPSDIVVREDDVTQQIKSVFRVPASVLLLLDTGGEANAVKSVRITREVAMSVISNLKEHDQVAALQVNDRVEVVHEWTADKLSIANSLASKLMSGKRALLSEGIAAAVAHLRNTPVGSRHLVLITDGAETPGGKLTFEEAARELMSAGVTTHVISYTALGRQATTEQRRIVRPMREMRLPEEVKLTLPRTAPYPHEQPELKDMVRAKGGSRIDLDFEMRRRRKEYEAAMKQGERQLASLADETGGDIWLPISADEMISIGSEVAHEIDAQYVVTYTPTHPITSAAGGEYRRVTVVSRRNNLRVRSRRGYVIKPL